MRIPVLFFLSVVFLFACNKDKYSTAPQIKYKSLSTNVYDNSLGAQTPAITFSITDAQGDLGDTAYINIKNLLTGDSIQSPFPDLSGATRNDFKADVIVSVGRLGGSCIGGAGHIDTMYYELFVTDFAKNKSNTIVTGDPVFQQCQ